MGRLSIAVDASIYGTNVTSEWKPTRKGRLSKTIDKHKKHVIKHIGDFFNKAFHLYYDGFKSMTIGRTLWAVIIVKLFIIFIILKIFFFPDFLKTNARGNEAEYVGSQMVERMNTE